MGESGKIILVSCGGGVDLIMSEKIIAKIKLIKGTGGKNCYGKRMPITLWLPPQFGFKEGEKIEVVLPITLEVVRL